MSELNGFYHNYVQYFEAIDACVEKNLLMPSLTLIYSGIDTFSWLAYGDIAVRHRFVDWVESHMYHHESLGPSSLDLYAARCAILHTLTPDSNLSKSGQARVISYAWGSAKVETLASAISKSSHQSKGVAVHLNDLHDSFRGGIKHFMDTDGEKKAVLARITKHFSNLDIETVQTYNDIELAPESHPTNT